MKVEINIKKVPNLLLICEMQIKITMKYYFTSLRIAKIKNTNYIHVVTYVDQ